MGWGLGANLALVGKHGEGLELGDGLGNIGILLLGGFGTVPPQISRVGPPHPAPRMLLEFACRTGRIVVLRQSEAGLAVCQGYTRNRKTPRCPRGKGREGGRGGPINRA